MAWRQLPNAAAISEFQGLTGDCGQTAELTALHIVTGLALTANDLNAIVKRDQARGWASANGAEPLTSIAHDLDTLGIAYDLYGFSLPRIPNWLGLLGQYAGVAPVICQFANAGVLPGDEHGVHFHFVAALGGDPEQGVYAFADGDNSAARSGQLVTYTATQLDAACICGAIVVHMPVSGGTAAMLDPNNPIVKQFYTLTTTGAWHCSNGIDLFGGILDFYRQMPATGSLNGLTALGLPLTGEIAPKQGSPARVRIFERGAVAYDPKRELDSPLGATGPCYLCHVDTGAAGGWLVSAATNTLQQQLTTAQKATTDAQAAQAAAQAATQQAQQALQAAQAQLAQYKQEAVVALQLAADLKALQALSQ